MLGSVTEAVLRDTRVPVVVTPPTDPGPGSLEDLKRAVRTILVPLDLSSCTGQQAAIARGLAEAFGAQLLFLHVLAGNDGPQRLAAHAQLDRIIHDLPPGLRPCMALAVGDPAAQIAHVAHQRAANLILMALHTSPDRATRMGHVTYEVLCNTPTLIVAVPIPSA
jgi:nucleotide-binding universal stress UspA family protein